MPGKVKDDTFIEFSEFPRVAGGSDPTRRNLVKAAQVVEGGAQELSFADDDPSQPDIVLHREGERVLSIDFHCKCGCSASVRLEYDEG